MCSIGKSVGLVLGLCSVMSVRGQHIEVTEIVKPDQVWVSGVVVDASGAGIGQAELVLQRDGAEVAAKETSAAGKFEVPLLAGTTSAETAAPGTRSSIQASSCARSLS